MQVLVTNDDGVGSAGLAALAGVAHELGFDVTVAAPESNLSGASASLTGVTDEGRLVFEKGALPGLDAVPVMAVQAAPAMIVRAAAHGAFGDPPDLVLSGINDGPNTGHAVLHSGTVGAVLTAVTNGCSGVAFSLGLSSTPDYRAAVEVARRVVGWVADGGGFETPVAINVNVPSGPADALRGIRAAGLASFGAVQTNVTELNEDYVSLEFADLDPKQEPGTDAALLADGWATVTALSPVCEADVDLDPLVS